MLLPESLSTCYLMPLAKIKMRKLKHSFKSYLIVALTYLVSTSFFVPAESIQIRVFAHLKVSELHTIINLGTYRLIADGVTFSESRPLMDFKMTLKGDSIELTQSNNRLGVFK